MDIVFKFDDVKKLGKRFFKAKGELDKLIEDRWHFHYSDCNMSEVIDCLDYADGEVTSTRFIEMMDKERLVVE